MGGEVSGGLAGPLGDLVVVGAAAASQIGGGIGGSRRSRWAVFSTGALGGCCRLLRHNL